MKRQIGENDMKRQIWHEYRCTLPERYPHGSLGHTDVSARQGHYVLAASVRAAVLRFRETYPNEPITVQYWKRVNVFSCPRCGYPELTIWKTGPCVTLNFTVRQLTMRENSQYGG